MGLQCNAEWARPSLPATALSVAPGLTKIARLNKFVVFWIMEVSGRLVSDVRALLSENSVAEEEPRDALTVRYFDGHAG